MAADFYTDELYSCLLKWVGLVKPGEEDRVRCILFLVGEFSGNGRFPV